MFFTIFLLFLAVGGYLLWQMRQVSRVRLQVIRLLQEVEKTYREFANQRLHLAVLEDRELEEEAVLLGEDAFKLLQPLLMSWQDLIQANQGLKLRTNEAGKEFKALYRLSEQALAGPAANPEHLVNRMNEVMQQSIEADLLQRITKLKTGQSLSA